MEIYSVLIYLTTFSLSLLFMFLSQELLYGPKDNHNFCLGYLFLVTAILIPCFLAAIRGLNVGTDIGTYILPNIDYSSDLISHGFIFFYENMPHETEMGFAYILYLGLLMKSISVSFFIMQLITLLPVYYVLNKYRKFLSVTFGFAIYYLLNYNFSLSGMRVSIAMSIVLLIFYYLVNEKKIMVIASTAFAFLFHNSALLISVLIFILFYFLKNGFNRKFVLLLLLALGGMFIVNNIFDIPLILMGMINPRYVYYLQEYMIDGGIFYTDFIAKVLLILICTLLLQKSIKKDPVIKFILILCLIGRCFVLANTIFYESMRIAYYFDMFLILYSAAAIHQSKLDIVNRLTAGILVLTPALFYWLSFIMTTGAYGTNVFNIR